MLGEIFGFLNSCFPDQKLILKVGNVELGEEEIKAIEKKNEPKLCICCEEITEENAHLHRNCGK